MEFKIKSFTQVNTQPYVHAVKRDMLYFASSIPFKFLRIKDLHCQTLGFIWHVVDLHPLMFQHICNLVLIVFFWLFEMKGLDMGGGCFNTNQKKLKALSFW